MVWAGYHKLVYGFTKAVIIWTNYSERNSIHIIYYIQQNSNYPDAGYSERQLSGSAWPFGWICREFYKINFPWNYRLSDQVQYCAMASRTANQAWSKGL